MSLTAGKVRPILKVSNRSQSRHDSPLRMFQRRLFGRPRLSQARARAQRYFLAANHVTDPRNGRAHPLVRQID